MGITVVPSAITGQTLSAADWNTQVRDNINGIWVLTTAGDMLFATGAGAANRLPLVVGGLMYGGASAPAWLAKVAGGVVHGGASGPAYTVAGGKNSFLKADGSSGVAFASPLYRRQGGHATIFTAPGTTNYTPAGLVMQSGYTSVVVAGFNASVVVNYPVAFVHRPHIVLSAEISGSTSFFTWGLSHTDDTASGFTAHIRFSGSTSLTVAIGWLAISDE
jgi:hypothetical protein